MGKDKNEIQKAYRERQKLKGPEFLEKERVRQRGYYVPAKKMPPKKLAERNHKNKLRNRLSRLKKKEKNEQERISQASESDSGYGTSATQVQRDDFESPGQSQETRLIVKLPLRARAKSKGVKKVRARALAKAHHTISKLQAEMKELRKKVRTKNKKMDRLLQKIKKINTPEIMTPNKKTTIEKEQLNLTPKRKSSVKKKLLACNTLMAEVKRKKNEVSHMKRTELHRSVSGMIARKNRRLNWIASRTGMSWRSLKKATNCNNIPNKRRNTVSSKIHNKVESFLRRDDNSRAQPGKADAKKLASGEVVQTRVLTDYMKNIHQKFLSENPEVSISLSTFLRLRPKDLLLASFISRNTCQCIHHQNMALKVQALRKYGIKISENPEHLLKHQGSMDELISTIKEQVTYKVWKKVQLDNGKQKMKIVEITEKEEVFKADLKKQTIAFSNHVDRVREQHQEVRRLKENLPNDDMMIQMDFAENFSCRSLDEVQTAYWNQSMVTIHPAVAYFKDNGELRHQSFVVVSDEMAHSSSTVCTFIDYIIPELKLIKPNLNTLHYWTDSPSSQYRNRFIFDLVSSHKQIYDINARWNYFETGHGKGPCDGLGGTTKRMADSAIKQGNAIIQDAVDFYSWATKSSMQNVKFLFVPETVTGNKREEMKSKKVKPLQSSMKLHAVGVSNGNLITRETSCYCNICITGAFCSSWQVQPERSGKSPAIQQEVSVSEDRTINDREININKSPELCQSTFDSIKVGCFVAVVYCHGRGDARTYIGEVTFDIDVEDQDCEINCKKKAKNLYQWPAQPDSVWVKKADILCIIQNPTISGKSGRMFKIAEEESMAIDSLFQLWKVENVMR